MVNFYSKKKVYYNVVTNKLIVVTNIRGCYYVYEDDISMVYSISPRSLGYKLVGDL